MRNKEKLQKAIEFRHELHRNPDLSGEERPTYERIQKFLAENAPSLEVVDKGAYIYALYRSRYPERPKIGFRCDVDALPIEDEIDKPYRSCKSGVGHKCGHDGHTAAMCALAMELDEFGAERDVYMLFQPAEENGAGAIQCIDFITDNNIAEFFGMHCSGDEDKGVVQYRDGLMNCASVGICVRYKGVSTHASLPELGKNPSQAIAKLALACDELTAAEEYEGLVMATVIHMKSGEDGAYGIAANKGKFQVTLRAAIESEMDDLESKLISKAKRLAEEYGLECRISYSDRFPETVNDPAMNRKLLKVCRELGIPTAERPEAERGSEDFGHFAKLTPSTMYMICMGREWPHLHSVDFDFDDDIIDMAVDIHMGLINDIQTG